MLAERGRLIECREEIEVLERAGGNNEVVQHLLNLKAAELQMERKIFLMSQALARMREPRANTFEIVNENPSLWSGTIRT